MSQTGTVRRWIDERGFGFISPSGGGWDVICHRTALGSDRSATLEEGGQVHFDVEQELHGGRYRAANVSGPGVKSGRGGREGAGPRAMSFPAGGAAATHCGAPGGGAASERPAEPAHFGAGLPRLPCPLCGRSVNKEVMQSRIISECGHRIITCSSCSTRMHFDERKQHVWLQCTAVQQRHQCPPQREQAQRHPEHGAEGAAARGAGQQVPERGAASDSQSEKRDVSNSGPRGREPPEPRVLRQLELPNNIFLHDWPPEVFSCPELVGLPLQHCSVGRIHYAILKLSGDVFCSGLNELGQLGCSPCSSPGCQGVMHCARLPWPAAAVSCGNDFSVALSRDGRAVCGWGWNMNGELADGTTGTARAPVLVKGLPPDEALFLLQAGCSFVIAITRAGDALGWGCNDFMQLATPNRPGKVTLPMRIAALRGRGLCRVACGKYFAVAETRAGKLLIWGSWGRRGKVMPERLRASSGRVTFPLRSLAASGNTAGAVDAEHQLWCLWEHGEHLVRIPLPAGAVRVAAAGPSVVALTADGKLWLACEKFHGSCRHIDSELLHSPLMQIPFGGAMADQIIILPETSCGNLRLRLFMLAAGRRGLLPGGQMPRAALVPFIVDEDLIDESANSDGSARGEQK
eukprot:TRINITY_DN10917_c0_g3_i1.p1 TRINITY_DN10917_c0_g3~~TRINITY_DN10917_c0_g3_i1.p1  ORF type:complete len:632 (+),score=114.54 TRINITY_DN10917_c0_g3_i1:85-1980(+)